MQELITVSAIIPAYNCETTLERAVTSLLNQSYPLLEIIIVDNNSSDNTAQIIEKIHKGHPHLIIPLQELSSGANNARNKGLKIATGSWIQLLDADDELLKDKIKTQVEIITKNPKVDVIYSGSQIVYRDKILNKINYHKRKISNDIISGFITSNAGITTANLWKLSSIKKNNYFDIDLTSSQEYHLMLKIYENHGLFIPDFNHNTLVYVSDDSVSRSGSPLKSLTIAENVIYKLLKIKEILHDRNQFKYDKLIKKQISKMYFSEYLEHRDTIPDKLSTFKLKYQIETPVLQRIMIYAHYIYSHYCPKSGWLKYPVFALNFVWRIKKMI